MRKKNNLKVIVTLLIVTDYVYVVSLGFLVSIQNIRKTKKLYIKWAIHLFVKMQNSL